MSAARWERLRASLAEAGVEVSVDARSYSEDRYGRVHHDVSRSVTIRREDGSLVEIGDRWWSKNQDKWIGWEVYVERPDGIVGRTWPLTKKRSDVVRAVCEEVRSMAGSD